PSGQQPRRRPLLHGGAHGPRRQLLLPPLPRAATTNRNNQPPQSREQAPLSPPGRSSARVSIAPAFFCSQSVDAASPTGRRPRRPFIRRLSPRDAFPLALPGTCLRSHARRPRGTLAFAGTFTIRSPEQVSLHG